jgi:hypothetical protein
MGFLPVTSHTRAMSDDSTKNSLCWRRCRLGCDSLGLDLAKKGVAVAPCCFAARPARWCGAGLAEKAKLLIIAVDGVVIGGRRQLCF